MENVLEVYERPYDPCFPVVNLDESPKQLIGQVRQSFKGSDGTIYEDYEYKRNGVVSIYMVNEALAGYRKVFVEDNHKAVTYARIVAHIVEDLYPDAIKVTLVEDNLSAHKLAALYELFEPNRARAIINRLEIVRTPVHGSWLNIAECELSVLIRYGLSRRVPTKQQVEKEVTAWYLNRNAKNQKIDWQFKIDDARIKLKHLYPSFQTLQSTSAL